MPHNDMDTAMAEAEMVMTGVFSDLLDRTGSRRAHVGGGVDVHGWGMHWHHQRHA
jgi:hypothetical protein